MAGEGNMMRGNNFKHVESNFIVVDGNCRPGSASDYAANFVEFDKLESPPESFPAANEGGDHDINPARHVKISSARIAKSYKGHLTPHFGIPAVPEWDGADSSDLYITLFNEEPVGAVRDDGAPAERSAGPEAKYITADFKEHVLLSSDAGGGSRAPFAGSETVAKTALSGSSSEFIPLGATSHHLGLQWFRLGIGQRLFCNRHPCRRQRHRFRHLSGTRSSSSTG